MPDENPGSRRKIPKNLIVKCDYPSLLKKSARCKLIVASDAYSYSLYFLSHLLMFTFLN